MTERPILWSFRRCPYAMRARLAIQAAQVTVEIREVVLRDKPQEFLETSPKGTVPVLALPDRVIEESRDIMEWAFAASDPAGMCDLSDEGHELIDICDGPFKTALDHTKYAVRYPELDAVAERNKAAEILMSWNARLGKSRFLLGHSETMADLAIFPFVRQFAGTDRHWFDAQDWPELRAWLSYFTEGTAFANIMQKRPAWTPDSPVSLFPERI